MTTRQFMLYPDSILLKLEVNMHSLVETNGAPVSKLGWVLLLATAVLEVTT